MYQNSAQIIATSPDVTVKLDLTCWNKVFHVYPKLRITTTITGPTIRLVYPSTQYCSTHSYEIKGLRIYNTSNQESQQSSLVPISSILRLHGSTPSQTNCPAAAGCWKAFYQSFPARPGSLSRQARGNRGYPGGNRAQEFLTTSFFCIFSPENAKNDVVRNSWARFPPSVLTKFLGSIPPFGSNDVVFGIFRAENAKNDVVRNIWAWFPLSSLDSPD